MNEFELQTKVMKDKSVKPADKFVMMCILKSVDWETWTGKVTQSYISKEYNVNRRTMTRVIKRLVDVGWISIDCVRTAYDKHETTITVNINAISPTRQNVHPPRQNVHVDKDKLSSPIDKTSSPPRQIVHDSIDKMSSPPRQNVQYINTINNNNKEINIDQSQDGAEYVTRDEAKKYTSQFHPRDLRHLADDRDKVPLHILSAKNRRLEIERRQAVIEEEQGRPMRHHERLNFISKQNDEDSKKYPPRSFERNNIRKVW